jgi:hypothetical protein
MCYRIWACLPHSCETWSIRNRVRGCRSVVQLTSQEHGGVVLRFIESCLRSMPRVHNVCPVCIARQPHKLICYGILKRPSLFTADRPRQGENPIWAQLTIPQLWHESLENSHEVWKVLTPRFELIALRRTIHTQVVHTNTRSTEQHIVCGDKSADVVI